MKIKKIIMALATVSVLSLSAMGISAYADDVNIPYTASSKALTTSDDTNEVRLNIYNTWGGNNVEDIKNDTSVSKKIAVNFTVSGLGTEAVRTNADGTTEDLYAYLIGSVGMNSAWNKDENGNASVKITGDGDYTATWNLDEDSDVVDSLILQTNIKIAEDKTLSTSGIKLKVNSISTDGKGSAGSTTATGTETATTATTTETTATTNATTTAEAEATTTTTTTTTQAVPTENNATPPVSAISTPIANAPAPTGDAGVGTAVTAMALAGVSVLIIMKKNK
ncbi:MAG: hypothetical protein K2G36_10480 [Ruminococcus sp.]|nr:hypothetical protein [Ruminococcus sp.]